MPRLLQINITANWGSHGKIAEMLGQTVIKEGWESYIAYGRWHNESKSHLFHIGNQADEYIHGLASRLLDNQGLMSHVATKRLVKYIKTIKPDMIHLHNIHGYYLNYPILFDYLASSNIPVVWTFHDCWPFTGHCAHYMSANCKKWMTHCSNCPLKHTYPESWLRDRSYQNFEDKQRAFLSVKRLTIVPVSKWLEKDLKRSFFKNCHIHQIYNGIDTTQFFPEKKRDDTLKKYNIPNDKKVVLGVASNWYQKGLGDFIRLSRLLDDHYIILLVGVNDRELSDLPQNIIGIKRTDSQAELRSLYSSSDVYFNPTWVDNFPTTNIEALACGTPIVVYDTGGCAEAVSPMTGYVVQQGNIKDGVEKIKEICRHPKVQYIEACRSQTLQKYNSKNQYREYYNLYTSLL